MWLAQRLLVWAVMVFLLSVCAEGLTIGAVVVAAIIVVGAEVAVR